MFQFIALLALPALVFGQGPGSLAPYDQTAGILFGLFDVNHNGQIERTEVHTYFMRFDANGDGRLTHSEFSQYIDHHNPVFQGHEDVVYDALDVNDDHLLDETDFRHAFELTDSDGDGIVSKIEFIRYWSTELAIVELEGR